MPKLIFASLFFLLLFGTIVAQKSRYVVVISEKANLRGTPTAAGELLVVVEEGDRFRLIETKGAWYLVETPAYVGWLHGNTIRLETSSPTTASRPSRYTIAVPTKPVEVRQIPRVETRRPDSGTVMASGSYRTGLGELTISNGTESDAIAKLIDLRAGASYREVYIQANSATTIDNIAIGNYELIFSLGRDYAPSLDKFLTNASYSKFDSYINFTETKVDLGNTVRTNYDSYRLTLNKVVGGNAATSRISEAEFTKY